MTHLRDVAGAVGRLFIGLRTVPSIKPCPHPASSAVDTAAASTVDIPECCGYGMTEGDPEVWYFPGEPVGVDRTYRCGECDWVTHVQVTDRDEADYLASEVASRDW